MTSSCCSGSDSIGAAADMIRRGDAKAVVTGGAESTITPIGFAGFGQAGALSVKRNDQPNLASRPFDQDRDGFVMGEGAGILVLEELEHAKKRKAKIYAEIIGYGMSGDAYHITAPSKDGLGGFMAMNNACKSAKINSEEIDYINAHGTSTIVGDSVEVLAIKRLFNNNKPNIMISSTKSSIGHLLGAAGSVELIFSILSIFFFIGSSILPIN